MNNEDLIFKELFDRNTFLTEEDVPNTTRYSLKESV